MVYKRASVRPEQARRWLELPSGQFDAHSAVGWCDTTKVLAQAQALGEGQALAARLNWAFSRQHCGD